MKFSNWEQGTAEWLAERRGLITASRFRDALDRFDDIEARPAEFYVKEPTKVKREAVEWQRGALKSAGALYAMDLARERCGGSVFGIYVNAQMRFGTEQEPMARMAYELDRGVLVREVGFYSDGDFGISTDGLVEDDGAIEIKTIASSDVLFRVLVEKDYSSFIHQIVAHHWMLNRKWVDLVLWTPDLPKKMHVVRFERDEDFIAKMEAGLIEFRDHVVSLTEKLKGAL